jgi:hypothetical protein
MADASYVPLLSAVAGGMLALSGLVFTNWRQARIEKANQRAAKLEELVCLVYELDYWLETRQDIRIYGATEKLGPSPLARIEATAAVFFPGFRDRINALKATVFPFNAWMGQAGQRRLQGDIQHLGDGMMDVYEPYLAARNTLVDGLLCEQRISIVCSKKLFGIFSVWQSATGNRRF